MKSNYTIYNASAGSGKTFTLVVDYLSLLFKSPRKDSYKNILAITFTNKAVAELKQRIIAALQAFSEKDTPASFLSLLEQVSEKTGLSPTILKDKAPAILKNIIHNYAAFEVSTIDGFTHRILRTFAKDLGLSVNFEVELNTDEILMEAVDSLISKAGTNTKLTNILVAYTLTKTDDDKSWDISRDLYEIAKLLTNENNQVPLDIIKEKSLEDFEVFETNLKTDLKNAKKKLKACGNAFFELISAHDVEIADFSGKYIPKHFEKFKTGKGTVNFETKWALNIADSPLYRKSETDSKKSVMDKIQSEIVEIFKLSKEVFFKIEFLQEIKKRLVQLSLLNEINKEIQIIKEDRNILLISEFNSKISAQVKDQPVPFIYERLGERYQNYFIDEFQDTSVMQWENLIPLIDHQISFSESTTQAGLTLVGDAKQSIYRWRGGRAEQFIDLTSGKNPFQIEPNLTNLPANYRSGSEIVNFNNLFFNYAGKYLSFRDYAELFKNSNQQPKKGDFGFVDIEFIEAKNKEEEFEAYPKKVFEIITKLDEHGFNRNDVCILTRRRSEGIAIAEFLNEHGIAIISSETLLISKAPQVQFIVNLIALSINPENKLIRLQVLEFLLDKLVIEDRHHIITENLEKPIGKLFNFLSLYELHFDIYQLSKLNLYEGVEYIIRSFRLVKHSDAYIQYFLDFVFETTQNTSGSSIDFLDLWESKKDSLSILVPEAENAVKIMTIHKSKGLEFPVVIYPFANSELQNTKKDNLWIKINNEQVPFAYINASKKLLNWGEVPATAFRQLLQQNELDTLNVFYVACTRAAQQLYILSNYEENKNENNSISTLLSGFLKESGKWDNSLKYTFGNPSKQEISKNSETHSIAPKTFYSSAIQNKAVNIVTKSGALWDTKQEEAIEKGEIAHEILAKINTVEDFETAISHALSDGLITKEQEPAIKSFISKVLNHPKLKALFAPQVVNLNEKEILTANAERIRPDRLNFDGNNVIIIDYKTGGPLEKHVQQIKSYAKALSEMGYLVKKCLLVYINKELIIKDV